ncbi:hypothetical protein Agub_g13834, partial [Astrephomene gubernaculifera]
ILSLRAPPSDGPLPAPGHRHARTFSDIFRTALGAPAPPATSTAGSTTAGGAAPGLNSTSTSTSTAGASPGLMTGATTAGGGGGGSDASIGGGRSPCVAPLPEFGVMPYSSHLPAPHHQPHHSYGAGGLGAAAAGLAAVSSPSRGPPAAGGMRGGAGAGRGHHRRAATASECDAFASALAAPAPGAPATCTSASTTATGITPTFAASNPASAVPRGGGSLPPATLLALAAEPGLVACQPLLLVRHTLGLLAEGVEALKESLMPLAQGQKGQGKGKGVTPGSDGKQQQQQQLPGYLSRAFAELDHAMAAATEACRVSYAAAVRSALLRGMLAAFDVSGQGAAPSVKALESLLGSLHEELLALVEG